MIRQNQLQSGKSDTTSPRVELKLQGREAIAGEAAIKISPVLFPVMECPTKVPVRA